MNMELERLNKNLDVNMDKGYSLRCSGHTYVTLSWNGRFICCLDNDMLRMEEIIAAVEKRTRMKFEDIRRENSDNQDWDGLNFQTGYKKSSEWLQPQKVILS